MFVAGGEGFVVPFRAAGLDMAVTPAAAATSGPSRNGKKASEASTAPLASLARLATAIRTESSRLIWPAPTPTSCRSSARTIAFDLTAWQIRQAKARRPRPRRWARDGWRLCPTAGSASTASQSWTSRPPSIRRRSKPTGSGESGPSGAQVEQADAVLPAWLGGQQREGVGVEAGARIASMNRPGDAEPFGGRAVDRAVQADDPAERADRIAFVGQLEGLGEGRRRSRRRRGCCA